MRMNTVVSLIILLWASAALANPPQIDWSGGPDATDPVPAWSSSFATASGVSWLAVPGQLALSGDGLTTGVAHNVASFIQGAFGVEVADIDHDGDQDIIGVAESAATVTIWYNDGLNPPAFTAEIIDIAYTAVAAVEAVDLNGDQLLDLVTSSGTYAGKVNCYL
ncbi:MAG: VCBS repeat-containing protein, partial [Candidatus Krumholzibacteria bacterium]|nr:VCBS repeat-containing protein [Candidatus Krumholzibacteria bacterium]